MYDTVEFKINRLDCNGVSFLEETPCCINDVSEHHYSNGDVVCGSLGNLKVSCSEYQVKVKDGSLCKWYLGDNLQTMHRKDVKLAIEKLSDTLHLPMDKALITRLDVSQNFVMNYPPSVYFNHLGALKGSVRLQEPNGLYYRERDGCLCFYDKAKEQKANKEPLPELYKGSYLLRYEQRYEKRLAKHLEVPEVRAALLYDEAFYIKVLDAWKDNYKAIQKVNEIQLNFEYMRGKKELYTMGVLSLVKDVGGQSAFMSLIEEAQQQGKLTKKQALDIRQAVNKACTVKGGLVVQSEAIVELNKKVDEAVRYYR